MKKFNLLKKNYLKKLFDFDLKQKEKIINLTLFEIDWKAKESHVDLCSMRLEFFK